MSSLRLALAALALAIPVSALADGASKDAQPDLRPLAQASTKSALKDSKLTGEQVDAAYLDIQGFTASWAKHVLDVRGAVSSEDLRAAAEAALRDKLQSQGIGIAEQESIIDAARLQAEASLKDFQKMTDAQARVKRALEDSGTKEPQLSELFAKILDYASDAHEWVTVANVGDGDREPAQVMVEDEVKPLLEEYDLPKKHQATLLAALVDWLEARAALGGDAAR